MACLLSVRAWKWMNENSKSIYWFSSRKQMVKIASPSRGNRKSAAVQYLAPCEPLWAPTLSSSAAAAPPRTRAAGWFSSTRSSHLAVRKEGGERKRGGGKNPTAALPAVRHAHTHTRRRDWDCKEGARCLRCENSQSGWANPGQPRKCGRACRKLFGAPWTLWWAQLGWNCSCSLFLHSCFPLCRFFSLFLHVNYSMKNHGIIDSTGVGFHSRRDC